jgi:hypothetical protein
MQQYDAVINRIAPLHGVAFLLAAAGTVCCGWDPSPPPTLGLTRQTTSPFKALSTCSQSSSHPPLMAPQRWVRTRAEEETEKIPTDFQQHI